MTSEGGIFGNYRIDNTLFPVPTTSWEEQPIAMGLNGIPINTSYRIHRWSWVGLDGEIAQLVFDKFEEQQLANAQLDELETDPYGADLAHETYGTTIYTDFVITAVSPRTRGLPFYDSVQIQFEVFVS